MPKKIIAISGKQYSGKDTVAKLLLNHFSNFKRIGIGDAIKIEYGKNNGLSFEEIEKNKHLYRADLIKLGNEGRAIDSDYWLNSIIALNYDIIVPDVRVPHELEIFKKSGAFLLRVEASLEARSKRGTITNRDDATETALDNFKGWDYVISNNDDYSHLVNSVKPLFDKVDNYLNP